MNVKQIYSLTNDIVGELTGKTDLVAEDLSNIVDVGTAVFGATSVDNYVKSLINRIGKVIFVNRLYKGNAPSLLMDSWEFGSVLQKVQCELPAAEENATWKLTNGAEYKQDIFKSPVVSAKFFNKKVTFEIDMSFTDRQVKESFTSANELNGFLSMVQASIEKAMTIRIDSLIMRTINNMTAETLYNEFPAVTDGDYKAVSGVKAVNLLKLYNDKFAPATALTVGKALTNSDFIRFAVLTMSNYRDRLSKMSTLFNIGGKERFTPSEMLHTIVLSDFANSADVYLQSDVYHNEFTKMDNYERVPYWQGTGTDYSFGKVSDIHVHTVSGHEILASGILAVMFDKDAIGVSNLDRRVTTAYNAKAEFTNTFTKFDCGYFNDTNENFIVYFIA